MSVECLSDDIQKCTLETGPRFALFVYDLETTGIIRDGRVPKITQICGRLTYEAHEILINRFIRQNSGVCMSDEAEHITGISVDGDGYIVKEGVRVCGQVSIGDALSEIRDTIDETVPQGVDVIFVAHNGFLFDNKILWKYVTDHKMEESFMRYLSADTMTYASRCTKSRNLKLKTVYCCLFPHAGTVPEWHDARGDVYATVEILSTEHIKEALSTDYTMYRLPKLHELPFRVGDRVIVTRKPRYLSEALHDRETVLIGTVGRINTSRLFYGFGVDFEAGFMKSVANIHYHSGSTKSIARRSVVGVGSVKVFRLSFNHWDLLKYN